jgi:hypothetical protein
MDAGNSGSASRPGICRSAHRPGIFCRTQGRSGMVQGQVQQAADSAGELRFQRLHKVGIALFVFCLVACATTYQWSASHPYYSQALRPSDSIAILGIDEAFVLTRDKWFANHLDISRDSVYQLTGKLMESTLIQSLGLISRTCLSCRIPCT